MRSQKGLTIFVLIFLLAQSFHFNPDQMPYERKQSQKYAAYSVVTHCPKTCILSWKCGSISHTPRLVNITYLQNSVTKASGFIGYQSSTQTLITSWRGSQNAQNWISNVNFETTPYLPCLGCLIHTGFWLDYKSNEKLLLSSAQAILKFFKVSKIVCTGHSLGGALSTITGIQFAQKFPGIPIEVHNFGSPRIGNENLANFIKSKINTLYRVVHNRDLVPHLPPSALFYKHPAFEVLYDQTMTNYKVCNNSGQDPSCSDQYAPHFDTNDHDLYFILMSQPKC